MTMKLPRDGREPAEWTVTTADTLSGWEIQLKYGDPWHPVDSYTNKVISVLLKGPDFIDTDNDGLGLLVAQDCTPRLRVHDTPDVIVRVGSGIKLTGP